MEKPKREAILDLQKYMNERIRVKFTGGREGTCSVNLFLRTTFSFSFTLMNSYWCPQRLRSAPKPRFRSSRGANSRYCLSSLSLTRVNGPFLPLLFLEPEPHIRTLGLVVLRGPTITLLNPVDGSAEIENPFAEQ